MRLQDADALHFGGSAVDALYLGASPVYRGTREIILPIEGTVFAADARQIAQAPGASVAAFGEGVAEAGGAVLASAQGRPVLRFDGAGLFRFPNRMPAGKAPRSLIVLMRPTLSKRNVFGYGGTAIGGAGFDLITRWTDGRDVGHFTGGGFDTIGAGAASPADRLYVFEQAFDGENVLHFLDGVETVRRAFELNTAATNLVLGGGMHDTYNYFVGDIAAFYALSRVPTSAERAALVSHLLSSG